MGLKITRPSTVNQPEHRIAPLHISETGTTRKRGLHELAANTSDQLLFSPKKRRCTLDFVYEELFVRGEGSDVTVIALNRKWNLHSVFMKQSKFFGTLLADRWKKSKTVDMVLELDIPDPIINQEALFVLFGALYKDDVEVRLDNIVPTLAAASYFDMESMLSLCQELMIQHLSFDVAVSFFQAAAIYCPRGELHRACAAWLRLQLSSAWHSPSTASLIAQGALLDEGAVRPMHNETIDGFVTHESKMAGFLAALSPELMTRLVRSSSTLVVQVEMDLFDLLCAWLYVRTVNPDWPNNCVGGEGDERRLKEAAAVYFKKRAEHQAADAPCYLDLEEMGAYRPAFISLRIQHALCELQPALTLQALKILPKGHLDAVCRQQWMQLLSVERGDDLGPTAETVSRRLFLDKAARCSRFLEQSINYLWRWTGFGFGLDVLLEYRANRRQLLVMRNVHRQTNGTAIDLARHRRLMLRVGVLCVHQSAPPNLDAEWHRYRLIDRSKVQFSDILALNLGRDKSEVVLTLRHDITFPLFVRCDLLPYTPMQDALSTAAGENCAADFLEDNEEEEELLAEYAPGPDDRAYQAHQQGDIVVIN